MEYPLQEGGQRKMGTDYTAPWLKSRENTEKPDDTFMEMLEEIFRSRA